MLLISIEFLTFAVLDWFGCGFVIAHCKRVAREENCYLDAEIAQMDVCKQKKVILDPLVGIIHLPHTQKMDKKKNNQVKPKTRDPKIAQLRSELALDEDKTFIDPFIGIVYLTHSQPSDNRQLQSNIISHVNLVNVVNPPNGNRKFTTQQKPKHKKSKQKPKSDPEISQLRRELEIDEDKTTLDPFVGIIYS